MFLNRDITLIFFNYLLAVLYRELDSLDQASTFNIRRAQTQTSILGSFFDEFSIIGILLTLLSLGKTASLVHTGKVSSVDRFIQWGAHSVAGALAILNTVSFALSEKQYADDGHRVDPTALKYLGQITFAMLAIQMTLNVSILAKSIVVTAPTRAVAGVTTATRYLIIAVFSCYSRHATTSATMPSTSLSMILCPHGKAQGPISLPVLASRVAATIIAEWRPPIVRVGHRHADPDEGRLAGRE
ncbi:hypothetical protein PCL_12082 [Purpureocillium lilacinum]|uniref:Uncharacterized protein n=1 Tax=Purpureocillium lilacinum TaxID=33203 RepID=A0A2U3DPH9_PURLI|nr:hypothetical protein PCL_12082 [Purpureocillium lilacinum]